MAMNVSEAYDRLINPLFPKLDHVDPNSALALYNALRSITRQYMLERAQHIATGIPLQVESDAVKDLQNIVCVQAALSAMRDAQVKNLTPITLESNVVDLEMTVRTTNLLLHNGMNTINDILDRGAIRLLQLPHFGKRQYNELSEVLEVNGYVLSDAGR